MFRIKRINCKKEIDFFVILYGTYEYDGRVKRLIEVLESIGTVVLIDVTSKIGVGGTEHFLRRKIEIPEHYGVVRRHLCFWLTTLTESRHYRPKVIVGANYFSIFPARLAARISKALLVYDAYELIIPEPGKSLSIRELFWYLTEKLSIKNVDLIIAANEDRARLMQLHYKLKDKPVAVRNIPPLRNDYFEKEYLLKRFPELVRKSPNERLLLYQGYISKERGIDRFIAALNCLPKNYRLIVAGGGPDIGRLMEIGQTYLDKERFSVLGQVENSLLPALTAMVDIGLITYPFQGLNNIYCSPNKIYEYAQAGLPVVATDQPSLRSLVKKYGIGELFGENDSLEKIAELIKYVIENKMVYTNALRIFIKENSWEDEKEILKAAIDGLMAKKRVLT